MKIENVSSRDALVDKIENDENVIAGFVVKNATDLNMSLIIVICLMI